MILACLLVAAWLLCGATLRARFAIFDRIYVPPSVIAGFFGLLVIQAFAFGQTWGSQSLAESAEILRAWPTTLIAIVFAGMLLPRATVPWRQSLRAAGREVLMVWIIVLGQTAIGLIATWLLIRPYFRVPASFGMLIETGFAGGHGTANAMGQVFSSPQVNFAEGLDLGLLMATFGLVYGTVSGIVWINLAIRWGWVSKQPSASLVQHNQATIATRVSASKTANEDERRSQFARGLDPLLVQAIWLAMAMSIGWMLQSLVGYATRQADSVHAPPVGTVQASDDPPAGQTIRPTLSYESILGGFPLFIYTLLGGWIVRKLLKFIGRGYLIDEQCITRWTSMAMDVLVVAAIATLNLAAVVPLLMPFSILAICGMIWTAFCLMILSRRVLPKSHWFELGLINYGMSTGVTATGFILLRIVDPELRTEAAKDYALASPFSAPFIGGGLLTMALPLVVLERVPMSITSLSLGLVVCALIAIGWRLPDREVAIATQAEEAN